MNAAMHLLASALLALPLRASAGSQFVTVMVGGFAEMDACSVGQVTGLKAGGDGFLAVRAGPGTTYRVVDKIGMGQLVYLCDSADEGAWLAVVYSTDEDDCEVTSPVPSRQPYRGHCRAGWVKAKWIEVVAG